MSTLRTSWPPAAIGAALFAGVTAIVALAGFLQLAAAPEREPAIAVLPLADTHLARAGRALAEPPTPQRLDAAEREARAALKLSPARTEAWLQVAYAERQKAGGWSPAAAQALAQSYRVGPLAPDVGTWRLRFALEHWESLTPELRKAALAELDALWSRYPMRKALKATAAEVGSPAGRLAFAAEVRSLERAARARAAADRKH
ncbi:hypothetical protein [Caulobacter sp. 17J80-11]|uniref:hypothetical protein n=1 Tax=Caulobacter sp. 17J80-11 TaxID=2763502 RepID=UPI001653C63C|nr:hypothetical protein [Caulobacter sp. 17J80-11]MBC6982492.1 hypothetical protein [Caulobacter sp. 17J80-11]